jgi:hypothetical protein
MSHHICLSYILCLIIGNRRTACGFQIKIKIVLNQYSRTEVLDGFIGWPFLAEGAMRVCGGVAGGKINLLTRRAD